MIPSLNLRHTLASLSPRRWQLTALTVIIITGALAYSQTLHVPFIMDDHDLTYYGRRALGDILLHGGPRRVTDLTFALNYRLHGLQPAGFHFVNLAIHLATAATLFLLISSLLEALRHSCPPDLSSQEADFRADRFIPLTAALLFTLHPVQTQAVTYVIQRYTSLATLFYLLTALLFVRARLIRETGGSSSRVLITGAAACITAVLAIGSKQIAVTLPLMLIAIEIVAFRGRVLNRRFFIGCAVVVVLALAAGALHWRGNSLDGIMLDLHLATAEDPHMSRATYFLTQTGVVASYLRMLLLPYGQSLIHEPPVYRTLFTSPAILYLALHLGLIAMAVLLIRRSGRAVPRSDRTSWILARLAALGILWFYGTMSIESSFFPIRDMMFEHRIYLPSVGFFITVSAGVGLMIRGTGGGAAAARFLVVAVCVLLGVLTLTRNRLWNDSLDLWRDAVAKTSQSALATGNLGAAYLNRNMPEKALPLLVRALELKPNLDANSKICLGRSLLGLNIDRKRFTTGEEFIQPGGVMKIGGPGYGTLTDWESVVMNNMALAYEHLGNLNKAMESVGIAVWLRPSYDMAWFNAGLISLHAGERHRAVEALAQLRKLNSPLAKDLDAAVAGRQP